MTSTSVKRTFDGKISDEPRAELQKVREKILGNMSYVEKSLEFAKDILSDCCNKIEDLRSQMIVLESIIEETTANNQKQFIEASKSVQERIRLKTISDQEIIEEITIEGSEKPRNTCVTISPENKRKRQRTIDEEISIITQQTNDKCTPGPSGEAWRNTKINRLKSPDEQPISDKRVTDTTETVLAEDVVEAALQKTKGVLSAQELNTFIFLSENVDDPVQLAKISFTSDIKRLYFQLMTFHFHLKVANDVAEEVTGTTSSHRDLEQKVQSLIHAFQLEIYHQFLRSIHEKLYFYKQQTLLNDVFRLKVSYVLISYVSFDIRSLLSHFENCILKYILGNE